MKNMVKYSVLILVVLGLVVAVTVIFTTNTNASQNNNFRFGKSSNLVAASDDQVSQYALDYVEANFKVNAQPEVVLAKSVTNQDLVNMGLDPINIQTIEEPPLKLVIVKGDFSLATTLGTGMLSDQAKQNFRIGYIKLIFDVWSGLPRSTQTSPNGGSFRKALNDPSLPVDYPSTGPLSQRNTSLNGSTTSIQSTVKTLYYGQVALTVDVNAGK
jgi:hypothetical protein